MKKIIAKITIFSLLTVLLSFPLPGKAQTAIYNIEMKNLKNHQATLTCNTDQDARVSVYFGKNANNLDMSVGSSLYDNYHSLTLTGLESDSAYYYKVVAYNENGEESESFMKYIDMENMADTERPKIIDFSILQTTNRAINFKIKTDEKVKVSIKYGVKDESLNKSWSTNSYKTTHDIILKKLEPDHKYEIKITLTDKKSNSLITIKNINTRLSNEYDKLVMRNLSPESYEQAQLMPKTAIITWESNVLAESKIFYGTNPEKLKSSKKISSKALEHKAVLENLQPNTIYYFKIEMKSDLNSKTLKSSIYSFKTLPLNEDYLSLYFKSGDVVTTSSKKSEKYLIYEDKKIPFSGNSLNKLAYDKEIKTISSTDLSAYKTTEGYFGKFYDGQVVKQANKSVVYVIDGKYKRPIANWLVFKYLNYQDKDVIIASEKDLKDYKTTELVTHSNQLTKNTPIANQSLVKSPEGNTVYLIANGKKLPFFSKEAFIANGYKFSQVQTVPWYLIADIPVGQVIIK
ncbi:MAG: fibronectin type III domain-containing protein [Candidatus Pacebacteria bacterium]|nr:fibronectin type III domain-containing protein [Candidatus Paceibacterota bacterium]